VENQKRSKRKGIILPCLISVSSKAMVLVLYHYLIEVPPGDRSELQVRFVISNGLHEECGYFPVIFKRIFENPSPNDFVWE